MALSSRCPTRFQVRCWSHGRGAKFKILPLPRRSTCFGISILPALLHTGLDKKLQADPGLAHFGLGTWSKSVEFKHAVLECLWFILICSSGSASQYFSRRTSRLLYFPFFESRDLSVDCRVQADASADLKDIRRCFKHSRPLCIQVGGGRGSFYNLHPLKHDTPQSH